MYTWDFFFPLSVSLLLWKRKSSEESHLDSSLFHGRAIWCSLSLSNTKALLFFSVKRESAAAAH